MPSIFIHEFGHAFSGLSDEYSKTTNWGGGLTNPVISHAIPHCSLDPKTDYSSKGILYGGTDFRDCTVVVGEVFKDVPAVFRPSKNSIMNNNFTPDINNYFHKFNVISCGYLMKNINDDVSAKKYWSDCAAMPGIIPVGQ